MYIIYLGKRGFLLRYDECEVSIEHSSRISCCTYEYAGLELRKDIYESSANGW